MKKVLSLLLATALSACGSTESTAPATAGTPPSPCTKDTDCKGARICESGKCVDPTTLEARNGAMPETVVDDAAVGTDAHLQAALIAAMRLKPGTHERLGDSGDAIKGYIQAGLVDRKPNSRADYSDYRILKRPATFMGHRLMVIEEEYMDAYVGCCVSPGVGVTVRLEPQGQSLDTFADENGCSVVVDGDYLASPNLEGLPQAPPGTYATLECKERDIPQEL